MSIKSYIQHRREVHQAEIRGLLDDDVYTN